MRCERARERLSALLDRELGVATAEVEDHLAECAACARELAQLRAVSRLLRVEELAPDPYFVTRFRARRDDSQRRERQLQGWRRFTLRFLLPATAAAITLASVLVLAERPEGRSFHDLERHALSTGSTAFESRDIDPGSEPLLAAFLDDGQFAAPGGSP